MEDSEELQTMNAEASAMNENTCFSFDARAAALIIFL
jgi:hypothetical protein